MDVHIPAGHDLRWKPAATAVASRDPSRAPLPGNPKEAVSMNPCRAALVLLLLSCAGCAVQSELSRPPPLYVAQGQRSSSIHHASANELARQLGSGRVRPVLFALEDGRKAPLWIHATWKRECRPDRADHSFEIWVTSGPSETSERVTVDELILERAVGHEWEKSTCSNASTCGKHADWREYGMGCRPTCIRGTVRHRDGMIDASSGDPACVPPRL